MKSKLQFLLARFEEPSTWAGTGIAALLIHTAVPGPTGNAVLGVLASVAALLAIIIPEK